MRAGPRAAPDRSGLVASLILGASAVGLGLAEGTPFATGAWLGAVGVGLSGAWRALGTPRSMGWSVLPAMLTISAEVVLAPYAPSTALLAGVCGVALLFWIANDPGRTFGVLGRRSYPIAVVAVAVGLSMAILFVVPRGPSGVGVAGGLLALAMVLVAILLNRTRLPTASPPKGPGPA